MSGRPVRGAAVCGAILALHSAPLAADPPAVTVRFSGESAAQWEIEPRLRSVDVLRGVVFANQITVRNKSAQEVAAMVVKDVRPPEAAGALIHLGCGPTFTLILKPGESAAVPASYFVAEGAPAGLASLEIAYAVYSFAPSGPGSAGSAGHASARHHPQPGPLTPAAR